MELVRRLPAAPDCARSECASVFQRSRGSNTVLPASIGLAVGFFRSRFRRDLAEPQNLRLWNSRDDLVSPLFSVEWIEHLGFDLKGAIRLEVTVHPERTAHLVPRCVPRIAQHESAPGNRAIHLADSRIFRGVVGEAQKVILVLLVRTMWPSCSEGDGGGDGDKGNGDGPERGMNVLHGY